MILTAEIVAEIKSLILSGDLTQKQIGAKYNASRSVVSDIATNRVWRHVPWPGTSKAKKKQLIVTPSRGPEIKQRKNRILVIGDLHEPVTHPAYLDFCTDLYEKHNCNRVMFIGDVVDWHGISFHAQHPDSPGTSHEYQFAKQGVQKWCRRFPTADVMIGNHDDRPARLAESVGMSRELVRSYDEIWNTPGWRWSFETTIDDIHFFHGTGCSGDHPAYSAARKQAISVVVGHVHSAGGVKWLVNTRTRMFAMDVGSGIDDTQYAFVYGRQCIRRSVLSAGVILDNIPYHEIMPAGPGEKYNRNRFKKSRLV